jgi:hypothetical protein
MIGELLIATGIVAGIVATDATRGPMQVTTIWRQPASIRQPEGAVCPRSYPLRMVRVGTRTRRQTGDRFLVISFPPGDAPASGEGAHPVCAEN